MKLLIAFYETLENQNAAKPLPENFSGLVKAGGGPVNDLNNFLTTDHKRSGCPIEVVTSAFEFALERRD